jgi:ComF family protein
VGVEFFDEGVLVYRASAYLYRGLCATAVQALKYQRRTSMSGWMAREVEVAADRFGLEWDLVAPVPIHWSRRAHRGFNQAEILAERLGGRDDVLSRTRKTRPQVGLPREERLTNLVGAFAASPEVRGQSVMLVDDVLTSGGTAKECAKALLEQGAKEVGILTFAGEPFHEF